MLNKYITKIIEGFWFSVDGFKTALNERAFQIELWLGGPAIVFALWLPVSTAGKAALIFTVFLILIVEVLNTAIEKTIDRISMDKHPLSKKVKDMGSCAVFLSVLNAGLIWGVVLVKLIWLN